MVVKMSIPMLLMEQANVKHRSDIVLTSMLLKNCAKRDRWIFLFIIAKLSTGTARYVFSASRYVSMELV